MTSLTDSWCGRILNLSDGGTEILGLPPRLELAGRHLNVEIFIEDYLVNRIGVLTSIRSSATRNTHAIEFVDGGILAEIEYACTACGRVLELSAGEALNLGGTCLCAECEEIAMRRLGHDDSHRGA